MNKHTKPIQIVLRFRQQLSSSFETEGYHLTVVEAPKGGWGGPFLPEGLDDAQMKAIRQLYNEFVQRRLVDPETLIDERSLHALRIAGEQLFRIFPETVQEILHHSQAIAQEQNKALEIVLEFDLSARQLLSLPWELLHHPEGRFFFALRGGGITRQLRLHTAPKTDPSFSPKVILGVWAEPKDISGLEIRRKYYPSPDFKDDVNWISGPDTLVQLEHLLKEGSFDGLHIVAHGRAGEQWSDLSLAFVGHEGNPHWINPDQLSVLVTNYPQIRFVYLDICASTLSQAGKRVDELPSGGLASSLVSGGVPAVMAMQDRVSQAAAGLFAQTFYRELSSGQSLAAALTQARRAVRIQMNDPIQWSIPTLYCQQQLEEDHGKIVGIIDRFLENIHWYFDPFKMLILAAVLLAGWIARTLAEVDLIHLEDWRSLGVPVVQSVFLHVLGAFTMWTGQKQLAQTYNLDTRGWLGVFLGKYTSAAVWALMWWLFVWLGWLFLAQVGWLDLLGFSSRLVLWFAGLLGLVGSGYVGARQSIRQNQLFLRVGIRNSWFQDWLLFLVIPFTPLGLSWFLTQYWAFLVSTAGFYLIWILLIGMAVILGRIGARD